MKSDVAEEYVLREKLSNHVITTLSFESALQQLDAGQLDAVVIQNLVALQLIKKLKLDNLETRGILRNFRYDWSFAVTEGDKQLLADLNEGLSKVIANGTYDQLRRKWLGILEPDHTKTYIYITIVTAVIVMLLALLIARLWQGSLRRQVLKSTAELEYYKNDLETLVSTRTQELERETFKLNQAQEITHIGSYRWDVNKDKTTWTDELFRITGNEPHAFEPTYDGYITSIHADDKEYFRSLTKKAWETKAPYSGEYRLTQPDGEIRNILEKGEVILDSENDILALVGVIQDITEQKISESEKDRLQRELSQSQKMDALGQLTGGIAHDFNNILGIIIGYVDLALEQKKYQNDENLIDYLKNIQQASDRAKKLVSQMMVFSRSDNTESKPLQLAPLLKEDIKMLRSTLPSSIELDISYEDNLPNVVFEPVKLQSLLINLCVNAKDAMNGTGKISISLKKNKRMDDECSICHKHIGGEWIELTITDTGSGIKEEAIEHIFEPFFTTKTVGKGTGMGMAMVGSIVKTFNGHIIVKTGLGKGTSFHLFFPPTIEQASEKLQEINKSLAEEINGHGESILIIDDEPELANFLSQLLGNHGFKCTTKTSSMDALKLFKSEPDAFDLVITDQTMPDLLGSDMIAMIREIKPKQAVILATGYSESMNIEKAKEQGISFIQKPFHVSNILRLTAEAIKNEQDYKNKFYS